jgi:D-beta-D-heptose 7-phosphate kinase/D-beta-D-heptose 1-phosphate adenosyltransferase
VNRLDHAETLQLGRWLPRLAGRRVLVVGDVILDTYIHGEARRLSPEAPVPVVEVGGQEHRPGGAANVAAQVAALGGTARLVGVVGADREAAALREALAGAGVSPSHLAVDPGRPTASKTRVLVQGRQVVRLDRELVAPLPAPVEESLLGRARDLLGEVDACVLSDYAKGVVSARLASGLIRAAARAGRPLVADPKATDVRRYRGATVVKPNRGEAARLTGTDVASDADARAAGALLVGLLGGAAVLLTLGAGGMLLCRPGAEPLAIPAVARVVFDVTGAGDAVAAVLGLALAGGAPVEAAARLANAAAGVAVGKVGTATVSPDELVATLGCRGRPQ